MEQLEAPAPAAQAQGSTSTSTSSLLFAINGLRFHLPDPDPNLTLLHFLRSQTPFKGPKLGCGEGGCGACVVLLSTFHPATGHLSHSTVSSCLTPLPAVHHCSITTTEALGSSSHGYHSIHHRLAGFHASQCGFCTPGICVSLFSSLLDADADAARPEPGEGFSRITLSEAESAVSGHLCRCTGYRPIVDACKSFSASVDIEDLGFNSFKKKGSDDGRVITELPLYSPDSFCAFPEFLKSEIRSSVPCRSLAGGRWHCPRSIQDLRNLLDSDLLKNANHVKLVSGNTSSGVYRELQFHDHFVDLRGIPELNIITKDNDGVKIGASVTISKVIKILREDNKSTVFLKLVDHMEKVASKFIRNMASIGGNLIMAQRDRFESDIATILLGAAATVNILFGSEMRSLTLEEFLKMSPCTDKTILLSIYIPSWISSPNVLFQTYRASARPLGNAVAYMNASFLAPTVIDEKTGDVVLDNVRLAFGAYGTEHAIRARKVEAFLRGKTVTLSILLEAVRILRETLVVKEGTSYAAYRISLAIAFLFKFLSPVTKGIIAPRINGCVDVETSDPKGLIIGDLHEENQILHSSKQKIEHSTEYFPVGAATKKIGSEMQASGEAVYVDDIPSPRDCLYGAFIYSTKPLAYVKDIGLSSLAHNVVSVVSANDIPKEGSNVGARTIFGSEPLFADSIAEYAGQPIALVVAESQTLANMAAGNAIVSYSTDNLEAPILTLEAAVQRSSYFEVPPFLCPQQIGDFSKGMEEADHKIISSEVTLSSQYWFYMETQTALAVPDEDDCIVVYTSSQTPETAQNVIATCLGIPFNNVRVITRRVGGGFGGKAVRAMPVAAACALAAHNLRRPVRIYLDRKTDMIISGGRHPMKATYSVGFKSDGKITALHLDILINAGATQDISLVIPHNLVNPLKKYNWGALSFDIKVCKTNLCTKSAMRAPGEVQGSYIAEAVIENVASFLSLDVSIIREKNLHTYESLSLFYRGIVEEPSEYTLPSLISKLISTARYRERVETVRSFNKSNVWLKRGISCIPIIHGVMLRPTPGKVSVLNDGSVVVEVGGIELGQGLWTKVKQMTAFGLGKLGVTRNDYLYEKIRVVQADTLSMVQGGWTTGSTTSESSCEAVKMSCDVLVERLRLIKENLEMQNGEVTWDTLIKQASMASVNLSASAYWVPSVSSMSYLNYGAAVSEVEVDILTGSTTILQSDLIYDCGQSLNPAVDLGQIEGAFVQGIGYFMLEEYVTNADGMVTSDGTWTYKIPTVDTIPKKLNVELVNSGHHKNRVLSSKASGEPPLLLASSVHSATRDAIKAARVQYFSLISSEDRDLPLEFQLPVPAIMPVVKELCGFDHVEKYLEALVI